MSAEGQRFSRTCWVGEGEASSAVQPAFVTGLTVHAVERLTHAEQALKSLGYSNGLISVAACRDHLARAAEIERVAREITKDHPVTDDEAAQTCLYCRLRALVQP